MGINENNVLIVRYSAFSATVIICSGDIAEFVQDVNEQNAVVFGTLLEGARVNAVISNVPCQLNSLSYEVTTIEEPEELPPSATSDFGRSSVITSQVFSPSGFSSFDFPIQNLPSSQEYSIPNESASSTLEFTCMLLLLPVIGFI